MKQKLLFLSLGTKGDLFPFMGIALEMKARGYECKFLSSEDHASLIEQEGFEFESVMTAEEHRRNLEDPALWHARSGLKLYFERAVVATAERAYLAIEREWNQNYCALITNNVMIGGLLARERYGIPTASVFLHPYSHVSVESPSVDTPLTNFVLNALGRGGRRWLMQKYRRSLNSYLLPFNDVRERLGFAPIHDILGEYRHSVPLMLDLWPDWYCKPKSDWPAQAVRTGFVAYDGPSEKNWKPGHELDRFLEKAPIVFTMGSGMIQNFDYQVELFSETCRRLSRPGLLVSPSNQGRNLFHVGEEFKVIDFAPFRYLFDRSSAILSHGGIGTVARALASGKPTMVCPMAFDQFDNAHHLEKLGVGMSIPYRSLSVSKLTRKFKKLFKRTDASWATTLAAISSQRDQGAVRAADILESRLLSNVPRFQKVA